MAMATPARDAGIEERPRLEAVEIGDFPGFGSDVRLELDSWRTILVGRNGAGKSLVVQGLYQASLNTIWIRRRYGLPVPRHFRCDISLPNGATHAYEYRIRADETEEELDTPSAEVASRVSWSERCWTTNDGVDVWRIANSKLLLADGSSLAMSPGMGLLAVPELPPTIPSAAIIRRVLAGFGIVPAGVPREGAHRREILLSSFVRDGGGSRQWRAGSGRVESLAYAITSMYENRQDQYDEFVSVLSNLGLIHDVAVKVYEDPVPRPGSGERRDFASVLFDGVNIGLQSDGTLRIAEIVRLLLRTNVSCLLIEEPETAVHPGLLAKLLSLMDSYSYDRQLVVSTHSPQVVDWCKPEQLRLVERLDGDTRIRSLGREDLDRVKQYLQDDGTFADSIYGQADG